MSRIINTTVVNETGITSSYSYNYNCSELDSVGVEVVIIGGNGTVYLSGSVDGMNFEAIPNASTTFTGTSAVVFSVPLPTFSSLQVNITVSSGTLSAVLTFTGRDYTLINS